MSKHIIDRPRNPGDRLKPYVDIERQTGPGAGEKALHRGASTGRDQGQRLREFVRIEREAGQESE